MKSIECFVPAARSAHGRLIAVVAVVLGAAMLSACGGGGYGGGSSAGSMAGGALTMPAITSATVMPSQMVMPNTMVTFTVKATGYAPLSYQWMFNSSNIAGATMVTYTIASASAANSGTYAVTVTNLYGTKTSSPIMLTVM